MEDLESLQSRNPRTIVGVIGRDFLCSLISDVTRTNVEKDTVMFIAMNRNLQKNHGTREYKKINSVASRQISNQHCMLIIADIKETSQIPDFPVQGGLL